MRKHIKEKKEIPHYYKVTIEGDSNFLFALTKRDGWFKIGPYSPTYHKDSYQLNGTLDKKSFDQSILSLESALKKLKSLRKNLKREEFFLEPKAESI